MVSDLGGHLEEGLLLAPLWAGERSTFGFEVVGQGGYSRRDAPRSAEHHRTPRPVREGSLVQRNPTPGPYGLHLDGELSHGDRTEDLEGQSREDPALPASDSRARPRSAAGGPPCCEPDPHGVAVSSVARKRSSPSGT